MKHIHSFVIMLLGMFLFSASLYAADPIPGYTIFGPNKFGYTDLTGKVQYSTSVTISGQNLGSPTAYSAVPTTSSSTITFTGTGHSLHYCQTTAALSIRFSEAVSMTLTERYAIHMKIKRTNTGTGNIQSSFIKGTWGSVRVGFLWTGITTAEQEIVLKYSDRTVNGDGQYYCNGETSTYGTQSFAGGNWNELFRMTAASGESFEVTQIYIDADSNSPDPVEPTGDEDAPTNLQASVKSVADVSAVITASAEDENAITFNIYNGATKIATGSSTSGVAKDIEVTGLTPNTAYTLQVEAVDAANNVNPTKQSVSFTTAAMQEKRYYFFRGGDLPAMGDTVTMVDLREGTGTTIQLNNMTKGSATDYTAYTLSGSWFSFNQNLKASTDMSAVTQAGWTLKIKVRTNLNQNSFNIRLNNAGECFMISSGNLPLVHNGEWEELSLPLSSSSKTLNFTASMTGTIFQMHANGSGNGNILDIEYAYLTNKPSNPEKPKSGDQNPPTNVSLTQKSVSYDRTTLTVSATDEESPISYALSYKVKGSADEPTVVNFTGTQGTSVDKEISGLAAQTTYAFTLVAADPNGNEADPVNLDVTTTKMKEKRYYFYRTGSSLPAETEDLTCVDLRKGVGSTVQFAQGGTAISEIAGTNFSKYKLSSAWGFVRVYPTATTMDDVNGNWYLHMRYKSTHPKDVYVNVAGHDKRSMKVATSATADNLWRDTVIQLMASMMTIPVNANNDAFQIQTSDNADPVGTFTIDYAFVSNSAESVEAGYVDATAPVVEATISDVQKSKATITVKGTDDSDSKMRFTIADSLSYILNSGDSVVYTFTGLQKATQYTVVVNAVDTFGNAMTPKQVQFTTSGDVVAPVMQTLVMDEAKAHTIRLRMMATDNQAGTLTYAVRYGENEFFTQGTAGEDAFYTITNLPVDTTINVSVTATDEGENESAAMQLQCATLQLKASAFGTYKDTVTMYNYEDHKPGTTEKTTMEIRIVTYKNMLLFQQKAIVDGQSVSTGEWDNQMWIWNAAQTSRTQECAATVRPADTRIRRTEPALTLNNNVPAEFPFNMYANNTFGVNGQTCSPLVDYLRGYINQPSADTEKPVIFGDIAYADNGQKRTISYTSYGETNPEDVFCYVKEGDNEYIGFVSVQVPVKVDVTYECYLVDFNGNISDKRELFVPATIALDEATDNSELISQYNSKKVNVELTRSLSSAYYNTLSLPFALDAAQVEEAMGAGTKLAQLETAYLKAGDELYLGFVFTDHIEAGVPYLVQPAQDVTNPSFNMVVIDEQVNNKEIAGVVTFTSVINPVELTAQTDANHTVLMLMANNQLTFPNQTGTMNGMRAYFATESTVAHVARRASFTVGERQISTSVLETPAEVSMQKMMVDGQLIIMRDGKCYNAQGQAVK